MSGTTALGILTCSECGKTITRERKLQKTRRRWRWAVLALLLVIAGFITFQFQLIQRDGWKGLLPTTVLILINPILDIPVTHNYGYGLNVELDLIDEMLFYRLQSGWTSDPQRCGLYWWQWWLMIRQSLAALETLRASDKPPRRFDFRYHDFVIAKAVDFAALDNEGPLASYANSLVGHLSISGRATRRRGIDLVEWELVLKSDDPICAWFSVLAVPSNPPTGAIGNWVPPSMLIDNGRAPFYAGIEDRAGNLFESSWAIQSTGVTEPHQVEFDVYVRGPGFSGVPASRRIGTILGEYRPTSE